MSLSLNDDNISQMSEVWIWSMAGNSKEFIGNPVSRFSQALDGHVLPYQGAQVEKPQNRKLAWGGLVFSKRL